MRIKSESDQIKSDNNVTFWTLCPYCYYLYEYEGGFKDCCLKCQNCAKPFHGVAVPEPPPGILVEGKEDRYYCSAGYFPLKYDLGSGCLGDKKGEDSGARVSKLGGEKGDNEGFGDNSENLVLISDDGDDECGIGAKECKNEENFSEETAKKEDEAGPELQRKEKRKMHYKTVARNTKKKMGRGIRYNELSGNSDAELKEEIEKGSTVNEIQQEGSFEDDLEFSLREDDIFAGLESIM